MLEKLQLKYSLIGHTFLSSTIFLSAVIFLLVLLFVNNNSASIRIQNRFLINRAQQFYKDGDFKEARKAYEASLIHDNKNPVILAGIITSIASEGNSAGREKELSIEAKHYVDKALKVAGNDRDVLVAVGYLTETTGDYNTALGYYDKATVQDSNCSRCWFHKGHVLAFLGKIEEAREAYNKAYLLDPKNSQVLIEKGRISFQDNDLDSAYEFFMEAANVARFSTLKADALTSASNIKFEQGHVENAIELSKRAVDLDSKNAQALSVHGRNLAVIDGEWQAGVNTIFEAINLNPRISQSYWWIGKILRFAGNFDEAINYQNKGIEKVEDDNTILGLNAMKHIKALMIYDLAITYSSTGKNEEALMALKESLELSDRINTVLTKGIKQGLFKNLANDPRFREIAG